jgi:NAD(P)-dependent dehydrogenase (short-subunit alcohol dehydrogenase family)
MGSKSVFDLSGKVALITGGSRGLGRAFCESMAEFGADVACVGRDEQKLSETIGLVSKFGHRAIAIKADVSKPDEVQNMVDETVKQLGTIDILFNNAGITATVTKIHEMSIADWDRVIDTNLKGQFLCMRAVLPVMLKQKSGCIINISSVGALGVGDPEVAPASYGASKAGVICLTKYAAMEYAKSGIRINCIAPGLHETDIEAPKSAEEAKQRMALMNKLVTMDIPLGRRAQPIELKGLAVLLASDASSFITGQVFIQDGGQTIKV